MRIYYLTKKTLLGMTAIFLLICSFFCLSLIYGGNESVASRLKEPVYQGNTGKKVVAITVNVDWGEEYIPDMLKEFKKHNARVTFFVTGKWAEKNPELIKQMHGEGHSIQNHGYKHLHFNTLSSIESKEQIKKAEEIIKNITGKKTNYFASPYGEYNKQLISAVSEMDYNLIMWSIDTIDWQRPSPETVIKRVINKLHNDAIILMHPTDPTSKALPEMLKSIKDLGYKMVTIDKILIDKNKESKNNVES